MKIDKTNKADPDKSNVKYYLHVHGLCDLQTRNMRTYIGEFIKF